MSAYGYSHRRPISTMCNVRAPRAPRGRELRRLFIAAVAWTVDAVARWNTRHGQRRHLSDRPD